MIPDVSDSLGDEYRIDIDDHAELDLSETFLSLHLCSYRSVQLHMCYNIP